MVNSFYWQVYLNLEKDVLSLADTIHIDNHQMDVYSMKIADLLMHTAVEIESLSKKLYFDNGGTHLNDRELYFDTVCLDKLNTDWHLEQKIVELTCPYFYITQPEFLTMKPLKGANKGSSACTWIKAYNAVKHDRASQLSTYGRIRYLIKAMAALYLLNIYNNNIVFPFESYENSTKFDCSLGSSLFSIKCINYGTKVEVSGDTPKLPSHEKCAYLVKSTDQTYAEVQKSLRALNEECVNLAITSINQDIQAGNMSYNANGPNELVNLIKGKLSDVKKFASNQYLKDFKLNLVNKFSKLEFEAVLNKSQEIHSIQ